MMQIVPIGHEAAREFLARSIAKDRVAHAYCFTGPVHIGKTALAEWFVGELVGRGAEVTEEDFSAFRTNPDVIVIRREVEDEKTKAHIAVGQIRDLRDRLSMTSFLNSWKVAVVLEAETMTIEAANALLKTLEEPREKTVLILITNAWEMLPQTVRSRCQTVYLRPVPNAVLEKGLEQTGLSRQIVSDAVRLSLGRPGIARRLAENKEALASELEAIREHTALLTAPLATRLQAAESLAKEKDSDALQKFFHQTRMIMREALFGGSSRWSPSRAAEILQTVEECARAIGEKVSARLALEHLLLEF